MRLTASGIRFGYGNRLILDDANLEVATGETVAIMGPSGVGKTTLLSLLGGMLTPLAGTVWAEGHVQIATAVSWILQTVNVLPNRTVIDNVALGALADGISHADALRSAATQLDAVGLGALALVRSSKLSGGELQRTVIARALAGTRPVLLADEPTGQLDRSTTESVLDCLFAARGCRAVVVVTHDPLVAARCDRVFDLTDGRLSPRAPS